MKVTKGSNYLKTETINVSFWGRGSVSETPIFKYGSIKKSDKKFKQVRFKGKNFFVYGIYPCKKNYDICYYAYNPDAECISIEANDSIEEIRKYIPNIKDDGTVEIQWADKQN